jgi:hypothetical protein
MSRKVLKLDYSGEFDFLLAGIVCGHKDYRLCFELNRHLRLDLHRRDDVLLPAGRPGSITSHSYYSHKGSDNEVYHVLSNKDSHGTGFYIPEMKNIDFFFLISQPNGSIGMKDLITTMRKVELVSGAYEIKPSDLKSSESFLLFLEN